MDIFACSIECIKFLKSTRRSNPGGAAASQGTIATAATGTCATPFPNVEACMVAGAVGSTEPVKAGAFIAGGVASGVLLGVLGRYYLLY